MSVLNEEMAASRETPPGPADTPPGESDAMQLQSLSLSRLAWRRFSRHRLALLGGVVLLLLLISAVFAPLLAPYNPDRTDFMAMNGAPSAAHPLGSDVNGRDILSRVLFGGRVSLLIGFASMCTAIIFGTTLGALAGYCGGWVDNIIMRLTDVVLSFPIYLLLFVLSVLLAGSSGLTNILVIVLVIMAVSWTYIARLVRGEFLSLKEREFIQAAHATGISPVGIVVRHLLPNAVAPIVVNASLLVGAAIILESVLSFFGFGVQPPTSSWGSMLADGQQNPDAWWETLYPGLGILLTVLSVNLIGDGLRDALDPFGKKSS